jgi:hypothetical protein
MAQRAAFRSDSIVRTDADEDAARAVGELSRAAMDARSASHAQKTFAVAAVVGCIIAAASAIGAGVIAIQNNRK